VSASRGLSSPQQGQCDSQCDSSVPIRLRAGAGSQKPPTRILASHWVPRASPGNSSASNQYLHVYNRFYFRYRVKPALLARLVPCLLSHIVVRTVRFRRLKSSTFLGNDSSAFSPKRRFNQICVHFILLATHLPVPSTSRASYALPRHMPTCLSLFSAERRTRRWTS